MVVPNPWMILPFALLLATIAIAPLLAPVWWSRHYGKISLVFGSITLGYYILILKDT
jgi:Na+/H+ antiporter NhaD/arsenite permease-like protein